LSARDEGVATGRKVISSVHVSLDGLIEGPDGALDWLFPQDDDAERDIAQLLADASAILLLASSTSTASWSLPPFSSQARRCSVRALSARCSHSRPPRHTARVSALRYTPTAV
jgi:RibD C-terminal domain